MFTPISVSFLTQSLILGALSGYFYVAHWIPRRQIFDLYQALFIFFHFLYTLLGFMEHAFYGGWDIVALFAQDAAIYLGSIFFILSAYHFSLSTGLWEREKRWAKLFILVFAIQEVIVIHDRFATLVNDRVVYWRELQNGLLLPVAYFWAVIIYYRQSVGEREKKPLAEEGNSNGWIEVVKTRLKHLVKSPATREQRAARAFAFTAIIPGGVAFVETLGVRIIPEIVMDPLITLGIMGMILAWVITYINHISDHTSYKTKFLGITMILFLMAVNLTCWSVSMRAVEQVENDPGEVHNALRIPIQSGTGYRFLLKYLDENESAGAVANQLGYVMEKLKPEEVRSFDPGLVIKESSPQPVKLPFTFNFFNQTYQTIYPYKRGAILLDEIVEGSDMRWNYSERPLIVPALTRVAFHGQGEEQHYKQMTYQTIGDEVIISWFMDAKYSPTGEDIEFHVVLTHSAIEWHFVKFSIVNEPPVGQVEIPVWFSGLLPGKNHESGWVSPEVMSMDIMDTDEVVVGSNGFVQDNALSGRKFIHGYAAPFAGVGFLGGALVCALMNLFLKHTISTPLNSLKSTLDRINAGEINLRVNLLYSDEFGYFASIFNRMADSIQNNTLALKLEHDRLEEQVETRKRELKRQINERSQIVNALKYNQRKMSLLLSNMTGAAYRKELSEDGFRVIYISQGCTDLFGFEASTFIQKDGSKLHELIHPEDREKLEKHLKKIIQKKASYSEQYRVLVSDGEWRWMLDQGRPVFDRNGNFRFFEGLINDVTQENLAKASLVSAKVEAEAANRAKSVFLTYMSHEIRTPLNAILGYSQLLLREPDLPMSFREPVEMIEISGAHLMALIDDILDFSKIESGLSELRPAVFDLGGMCRVLDGWFAERCASQGLRWNVNSPKPHQCFVFGDESKLRQVLLNLLSNAVKFTSEGEISLNVAMVAPQSDLWRFEVLDTGPGIPEEVHSRVFEPFVQHDAGIKKGGTGLGLAIAARHAALMGGILKLESGKGTGTRFYFDISLPKLDTNAEQVGTNQRLFNSSYNIIRSEQVKVLPEGIILKALIVDDVPVNREVMQESLERIGVQTFTAEDGEAAVRLFSELQGDLDLVFMDIRMPRMDGKTAMKKLHNESQRLEKKPYIVAFSASTLEQERKELLDDGFDEFFSKPFRFKDLENLISKHVERPLVVKMEGEPEENRATKAASALDSKAGEGTHTEMVPHISAWLHEQMLRAVDYGQVTELDRLFESFAAQGEAQSSWVFKNQKLLQRLEMDRLKEELTKLRPDS